MEEASPISPRDRVQIIEVFADIWCPFTHVGLKSVAEGLDARGRPDVAIKVRSWPLEWVNGGALDRHSSFEHATELRHQVAPDLFRGFEESMFPRSTIPGLALVAQAYRVGLEVGQALSFEIRDWLFERGEDVADPDTLTALAGSFGLSAPTPDDFEAVLSDWKDGRQRDVRGSPHFFCAGTGLFCPSLNISKDAGAGGATISRTLGRLEAFLDKCLS